MCARNAAVRRSDRLATVAATARGADRAVTVKLCRWRAQGVRRRGRESGGEGERGNAVARRRRRNARRAGGSGGGSGGAAAETRGVGIADFIATAVGTASERGVVVGAQCRRVREGGGAEYVRGSRRGGVGGADVGVTGGGVHVMVVGRRIGIRIGIGTDTDTDIGVVVIVTVIIRVDGGTRVRE